MAAQTFKNVNRLEARLRAQLARGVRKLERTRPAVTELLQRLDRQFKEDCEEVRRAIKRRRLTARSNAV